MNRDITKLITWKGEEYQLGMNIKDFLDLERDLKSKGEEGIFINNMNEYLLFKSIEQRKGKTLYLSLPEPVQERKEMTKEERKEFRKICKEAYNKTFDGRKKSFLINRDNILKNLAKDEIRFGLDTTLNKIEKFKKLKLKESIKFIT